MTFLSNMFARSFADAFYSAFRAIASLSLRQTDFNEEEYVCELFSLFTAFPLQFPHQFNQDPPCVLDVLQTSNAYLHSASSRGKTACLALLTKIAQLQQDNDAVRHVLSQAAPTLLHVRSPLLSLPLDRDFGVYGVGSRRSVRRRRVFIPSDGLRGEKRGRAKQDRSAGGE